MSNLVDMTLRDLVDALDRREVSALEATTAAIERIRAYDGRTGLNAFLHVDEEGARASAIASDQRRAAGRTRGPLDGVPIALKDLVDTADMPTTAGSAALLGRRPAKDAPVARDLRSAGTVLLGKTNMMEFAFGHPHPEVGETANPWDRSRTAGGSSGGSAAAVAAGMAWGAIGSDTGGSIRSPAAYCGVSGLKPTYGLVSLSGVIPLSWSLDHVGPIARTAEDCALMLSAIAHHDPGDPYSAHPVDVTRGNADLFRLLAGARPGEPLRVGIVRNMFTSALTPGLAEAALEAARRLPEAGMVVEEMELPQWAVDDALPIINHIFAAEAAAYHRSEYPDLWHRYGPVLREGLEEASRQDAVSYVRAQRDRIRLAAAFAELYCSVDLLVWPSQPIVAPSLGTTDAVVDGADSHATTIDVEIAATGPANLLGEPGLSVPCGFAEGMPVGLHFQGPKFSDATVLQAGMQFQRLVGTPPSPPLD